MVEGDFTGNGQLDLAVANAATRCRCCWATATAPSSPRSPTRSGRTPTPSWRATSTATASSTSPSPTRRTTRCRCCWATATAPSSPRSPTRSGRTRSRSWRATSPATASSTSPSPTPTSTARCRCCWATATAPSSPQVTYAVGTGPGCDRGGGLHRRRPARPRRRQRRAPTRCRCCWATATAPSSPRSPTPSGRTRPRSWRATSPATASSTSPSPTAATTRCRCCWATATAPSSPRSPTPWGPGPDAIVAGDFTGDGQLDLAVANSRRRHGVGAAGQRRRHLPARRSLTPWGFGPDAIVAGDFNGDGRLDLAVANSGSTTRCPCCWATATAPSSRQVTYAVGVGPRSRSWRATSTATASSTSPSPTPVPTTRCRCCWATATAPSSRQVTYAVGSGPDAIVAGDFNGDGQLDLAVANCARRHGVGAAGQRRRHVPARRSPTPWGRSRTRSWRVTSPATASSTSPSPTTLGRRHGVGAAGQRRRHLPARRSLTPSGRPRSRSWRGTSPAMASSTSPSPTRLADGTVSVLLGNGDGTFQPPVTYAVGSDPAHRGGDFTGDGQLDLAVADGIPTARILAARCRCSWATATARSSPRSLTPWGRTQLRSWRGTSPATASSTSPSPTPATASTCRSWATATAPSSPRSTYCGGDPDGIVAGDFTGNGRLDLAVANLQTAVTVLAGQRRRHVRRRRASPPPTPTATPLVADVNGDGTDDVLVVDGSGQHPLSPGHPRPARHLPAARHDQSRLSLARHRLGARYRSRARSWPASTPRTTPSRSTPVATAASSASDRWPPASSRRRSSPPTSTASGWDDLVVRNAGDGTLSVFFNNGPGSFCDRASPPFLPAVTLAGRPGRLRRRRRSTPPATAGSTSWSPTS